MPERNCSEATETIQVKCDVVKRIATMQRASHATQSEANSARDSWRKKLRRADGKLSLDVQRLRVSERSALSLVEEYASFEEEVASQLPKLEIEAADLAAKFISVKQEVIRDKPDDCYETMLLQTTEILAIAFDLHCRPENSGLSLRQKLSIDDLADQFFARLSRHICKHLIDRPLSNQADAYLALPEIDLKNVDVEIARSPARRALLGKQLSKNNAERAPKGLGDESLAT